MSLAIAAPPNPAGSGRIRIMVVDDSVVVRGLVSRWLGEADGFEVVGTASNGRAAVEQVGRLQPDMVLLDIEMPEMDGITALPELLKRRPGVAVVMMSTLTQRNAEVSLRCLALGAIDYIPKPESHREVTVSTSFRADLVAKLKGLGQARVRRSAADAPKVMASPSQAPALPIRPTTPPRLRPRTAPVTPRCLLIGASTGGPKAVAQVLGGLNGVLQRVPVLIVQHMPPIFTAVFADHLRLQTGLEAREPQQGERLAPGVIYVAPGGRHMGLDKEGGAPRIRLGDGPPENFCRPAVDVLFRDAAAVFGASALAVVLTGMGSDGTQGAHVLAEAGACVLAQDEATSTVWGMPGSIAKAGLAHDILPLAAIAPAIKTFVTGSAA